MTTESITFQFLTDFNRIGCRHVLNVIVFLGIHTMRPGCKGSRDCMTSMSKNTSQNTQNASPDTRNTGPDATNISPETHNTNPDTQNTSPDTPSTSPEHQNISADTRNTSPKAPISVQTPQYKSRHPKYK